MACASRCETYRGSMAQSEISLSPICAAVLSEQLHAACLCSAQWRCSHNAGGTETGNRRIATREEAARSSICHCRCRAASPSSIGIVRTQQQQPPAS